MKAQWAISMILMAAASQAAPQRPLAAGTYEQLIIVMRAADKCGFKSYRVAVGYQGAKVLYTDDDEGSYSCIEAWLRRSTSKLHLAPTFDGDRYDH